MHLLPARRTLGLSVQHVGRELLVYDEQTHRAFCLNAVPAAIWPLLDGRHTLADLAAEAGRALGTEVPEPLIPAALDELRRNRLLAPDAAPSIPGLLDRRAMLGRLGAGAALMLPVVTAIAAPRAAQAYGGGPGGGCVLGDTPVQLASGSFAPIASLRAGQSFRSFDLRAGSFHTARVIKVHQRPSDNVHTLVTASGDRLQATGDHLLLTSLHDRYGTEVNALRPGDPLLMHDARRGRVVETTLLSREPLPARNLVYHIETASAHHNYVAASLLNPPTCFGVKQFQRELLGSSADSSDRDDDDQDNDDRVGIGVL